MLREVIALMPRGVSERPPEMFLAAAGAGALLALAGGRFSRSLVTLFAVALGAFLGLRLPGLMGWQLDAIGAAFCGAIVLGLSAFVLHRAWIGALLAALAGGLGGTVAWIARAPGAKWTLPEIDLSQSAPDILSAVWRSLPKPLFPFLPMTIGIAIGIAVILACVWPRLARVSFFSILGCGILSIAGTIAAQKLWPQVYDRFPKNPLIELAAFVGLVTITSALQWLVLPKVARQRSAGSQKLHDASTDEADMQPPAAPSFATSAQSFDQKRQESAARRQRVFPA
jgi:hypothetical protein